MALLAALFALLAAPLFAELSVHVIDVDQGDATLLLHDEYAILVDAGPDNGRARAYLAAIGVAHIDVAIATHAHADHIGGFPDIFEHKSVDELWYNGQAHTTATFDRFLDAIESSDAAYEEPLRGDVAELGRVRIEVLHPDRSAADYDGPLHDLNKVVRIVHGDSAVLLPGDAEAPLERELLENIEDLSAQLLRVAHHGSRTSTTTGFLEAVSPEVAIYSAGRDNPYGHPHDEVIARLERIGAAVYGTDRHGNIIATTDGIRWHVETDQYAELAAACIDINTADPQRLTEIVHIGEARARALVAMRPFDSVEELVRIPGIADVRIRDIIEQGFACVE